MGPSKSIHGEGSQKLDQALNEFQARNRIQYDQKDIVLKIAPNFRMFKERVDMWFIKNDDLDHWIEGFEMAGFN